MNHPAAPDFRLYQSNALDVLAGLLADRLRTPAAGQSLLTPDIILIPQAAMRRWLQATLAQRHGISANLEFLTPGEFVARALDANLGKSADDLDAATLHWRLYAALGDPALLAQPAMAQLSTYLADGDAVKRWALAGELANVFEKYQAWRRDWLLRWEDGADPADPQALLWRAVAAGRSHRARRIQDYLARYTAGDALPAGLPSRLFVFATLNVSPDVLRVIATQARVGTLHFYLPTPSAEYWGDLQSLGARLHAGEAPFADGDENPLLRDWGAAGRDFMALLGSGEVVHPSAEFFAHADPALGGGELRGSLLRRMQGDLFHRRAATVDDDGVRIAGDDPSLQFHACHTRLRELQVLHDRLRALLEDKRFDPPLQPREIAVLAPDIDPYVPHLDAVFGSHGAGDPIPYTVADASPLVEEPLAEVFLRLLALPVSRFGLEETLDLLASAPLAEASGLDADDFERLHAWLQDAGVRWGIDAAHRTHHGAPNDDAYTWQFALDRLLLGHASDSEDFITGESSTGESSAGVAPWTNLEGSALAALDAVLRLLRVLARHQRLFGEAMSPAQWRERLLALLDALLPRSPATVQGQRALDRLRTTINAFAEDAERAGFTAPIAGEVVRAHFTAELSAADTRAPLLTGGVSFARMVPMRLLPFRVICLLGMNDGDFPRRDPAAGLNRLTAELGSGKRRRGDRSTRDDDRFLFLQLFAAAQDVFYLSWLGADPRDGSVREPSVLVTELLAAASAYHARPQQAAKQLVLRHSLQPFSPAAFGADDPRFFSYRGGWRPAATSLSGPRTRVAPWMDAAAAFAPPPEDRTELSLGALRGFLLDPTGTFLRQRLHLRLPEIEAAGEDVEPLQAPGRGLQRSRLQRAVFDGLVGGATPSALQGSLRARGLLPSGAPGRHVLDELVAEIDPYARAFGHWRGTAVASTLSLETEIDGVRLHGRITDAWPQGLMRLRFGEMNGPAAIRHGLDWLLAEAAGVELPFDELFDDGDDGIGPHTRPSIGREAARDALRALLVLRDDGLRQPLPFAPYSAWELFKLATAGKVAQGVKKAAEKWHGSARGWAEGDDAALRLALRGRGPFADADSLRDFAAVSGKIFGAVTRGHAVPIEIDGIGEIELPQRDDAEDGE
ncbi:exodeoxyribonuclease V subunit gamma [Solilutibacter silvestris]|uniref:RecBCD enzyme subunit RecC n=1 Tax=Solilutibacter silvestris TaxID=1645665 RepID=A0A2K1Q175_9GAMM|nr:exodeoxyribonuclease V subunit gamma [Lysobacter silvestris]PNS08792.1 recC: exodeoxyribonuclease V, gamma subunit [Lysobacter silvestris]